MNRREFLFAAGSAPASFAFLKPERLIAQSSIWRTFEVTTHVEVLKPSGTTRVWVPAALITPAPFQKTLATTLQCEGGRTNTVENESETLGIIVAEFPPGVRPVLTVHSRVTTRNWSIDFSAPTQNPSTNATQ